MKRWKSCLWCRQRIVGGEITVEHLLPKAMGGGNGGDNLADACADCNHRRGRLGSYRFIVNKLWALFDAMESLSLRDVHRFEGLYHRIRERLPQWNRELERWVKLEKDRLGHSPYESLKLELPDQNRVEVFVSRRVLRHNRKGVAVTDFIKPACAEEAQARRKALIAEQTELNVKLAGSPGWVDGKAVDRDQYKLWRGLIKHRVTTICQELASLNQWIKNEVVREPEMASKMPLRTRATQAIMELCDLNEQQQREIRDLKARVAFLQNRIAELEQAPLDTPAVPAGYGIDINVMDGVIQ